MFNTVNVPTGTKGARLCQMTIQSAVWGRQIRKQEKESPVKVAKHLTAAAGNQAINNSQIFANRQRLRKDKFMADTSDGKFQSGDEATREAARKGGEASGGNNR